MKRINPIRCSKEDFERLEAELLAARQDAVNYLINLAEKTQDAETGNRD